MKLRSFVLAAFLLVSLPLASSQAQVGISVNFAPPVLPVYEQPPCPVEGYIWTPGYWGYGYDVGDYYWVPGVWVPPPSVGLLWTPPYWGWNNGVYAFNQGYWGPTVGFYGGVNYGYGYTGNGYWGGRWNGNTFAYNTAVTRVNTNVVRNTYVNNSFTRNVTNNRASFNGPNGVNAQPNAEQKAAAANARKQGPTSQQLERQQAASKDQNLRASANKGKPNTDAVKSFDKTHGAGESKVGAEGAGTTAGAGPGKGENKIGNANDVNRQGAGAGQGKGKQAGAGAGAEAGQGGKKAGNVNERNLKGAGAGNAGGGGNKINTANQGKKVGAGNRTNNQRNLQGNQGKMHSGKMAGPGGHPGQPHTMNQMSRNPQMGARNAQMGGKHPQMGGGGNRPKPSGGQQQQQNKKKPGQR
jgi:hypothetical protein